MKLISVEKSRQLKQMTIKQLTGCQTNAFNSSGEPIKIYTPDGMANYNALWTRDFAYMVEYANDILDTKSIYDGVNYLIEGVRTSDGWAPDRVDAQKNAVYSAGSPQSPCGRENLDNGPFLVIASYFLVKRMNHDNAVDFLNKNALTLYKTLNCLPRDENGLIFNDDTNPHSPYGFTDCIKKTGSLCMESLLFWRGAKLLADMLETYGLSEEISKKCREYQASVEKIFFKIFWNEKEGIFYAATGKCRQADVWASCYISEIGFPVDYLIKERIANWLKSNYDGIVQYGQIRHTAPDEYWEECLVNIPQGEYQNGAYWATASGWFIKALEPFFPDLAYKTLNDVIDYFIKYNIYECINGEYQKLENYVVSATNVYSLTMGTKL